MICLNMVALATAVLLAAAAAAGGSAPQRVLGDRDVRVSFGPVAGNRTVCLRARPGGDAAAALSSDALRGSLCQPVPEDVAAEFVFAFSSSAAGNGGGVPWTVVFRDADSRAELAAMNVIVFRYTTRPPARLNAGRSAHHTSPPLTSVTFSVPAGVGVDVAPTAGEVSVWVFAAAAAGGDRPGGAANARHVIASSEYLTTPFQWRSGGGADGGGDDGEDGVLVAVLAADPFRNTTFSISAVRPDGAAPDGDAAAAAAAAAAAGDGDEPWYYTAGRLLLIILDALG
jgi:hypothetical protein